MPNRNNNQGDSAGKSGSAGGSNRGGNSGGGGNSGSKSTERGFAAMPDKKQREIAKKGGEAVSKDRQHMSDIGKKGGDATNAGGRGGNKGRS